MDAWTASWEDLGADGRRQFRTQCENAWAQTRAELEPREVRLAVESCDEGIDELAALGEEEGCDLLRALYLQDLY